MPFIAAASLGPIAFEVPGALWLFCGAVPLVVLVARAWPVTHGPAGAASVALRALVVAALILALARPVHLRESAAVSAVALLDVSASISDGDLARARDVAARLARAAEPPHDLRFIVFAARPSELPLGTARARGAAGEPAVAIVRPPGEEALETDIARAVGLGAGLLAPERTPRLLVVSDGRATRGDLLAQAASLAARGVRLDYVALGGAGAAGPADVAVAGISAPDEIRPHAPFPLVIRLAADRPARVRLALARDGRPVDGGGDTGGGGDAGGAGAAPGERILALEAGETAVTWTARLETPGTSVFSAEVRPFGATGGSGESGGDSGAGGGDSGAGGGGTTDRHPQNDRGVLAVAVEEPPRALVIASAAGDAAALVRALDAERIDTDLRPPARALDGDALARADLVVLCDVAGAALSGPLVGALERYVRDGGGLLVTGGPHAFGPGGWDATRLPALLPVRLDLPERRDEPTLALALVVDRSGSMTGAKMELTRQATRATAEMLPPDDQIAVIAFDTQATPIVRLQRAANRLRIAADIGRIQAAGGTNILAGLREAVDQLGPTRAKKKHVILLSDGQSPGDGIPELVDSASAARITISTVGVGEGVDEALLQLIASRGGGRYYHTRDPASIPRIFTREASELAATGVVERPTAAVPRRAAEMLAGVPLDRAPPLAGYIRTRPRAQAELILTSDTGDPLLARWELGLGQVAAWTSDLGPRWAAAWARWPPFPKLWAQIARATMRARAAARFPMSARADGGFVDAAVEAVGTDDRFLSGLEGALEVSSFGPDGAAVPGPPRRVPLVESAPGRYQARFPAAAGGERPAAGALLLRATLGRGARPVALSTGRLALPFAPELFPIAPAVAPPAPASPTASSAAATTARSTAPAAALAGEALLQAASARTGGRALAAPEDLFRGAQPRRTPEPLQTPLFVIAALLFVADVALRRLAASRGTRPAAAPAPRPPRR